MYNLENYEGGEEPTPLELEHERLQKLLKQNHMILFKTGLIQKMMDVQQQKFDERKSPWQPGNLGDSKFWLTSGGSGSFPPTGGFSERGRGFYITKADGEDRKDQIACRVFRVKEEGATGVQTLEIADGFDMRDAVLVYVLTEELITASQAGEIPHLSSDLHSLGDQTDRFTPTATSVFFSIDESLLDLESFADEAF